VNELYHTRRTPVRTRRRRQPGGTQFIEQLENRQLMSLTVDLRLPGGAKSASVTGVGQKISLEIWATVKGANTINDEALQMTAGSLLSTNVNGGAANGTLSAIRTAQFSGPGSLNGGQSDLDGDGDLDVGSNNDLLSAPHFVARADSMQYGQSFKIGTATFTVTSLKSTTGQTNLVFRMQKSSAFHHIWREDNTPKSPAGGGIYLGGAPLVLKRSGGTTTTTYSVSGSVFNDTDGDGIKDIGEAGRASVRVFVDKDNDRVFDTGERSALTSTSGAYTITGVPTGTTRVRIVGIAGYRITTPSAGYHVFTLAGNTSGKNFGVTNKVLITGRAWVDSDKDNIKDSTEAVLAGWTVFIDKDKDGVFDVGEVSTKTDSAGNYKFTNLAAGSYRIRIVQASGYTRIAPTSGYYDKTLLSGQTTGSNNFRFTKP